VSQSGNGETLIFSVVIPTLNEETNIRECVFHVRHLDPGVEVIVADGGSADRTVQVAREAGAVTCSARRGRGTQMNAGAALASGDIVLFLHADTRLPSSAFDVLADFFRDGKVQVGTFRVTYVPNHPAVALYSMLARHDTIFSSFGDQCLVVRKPFFTSLGGFPDWPLFEDVHFLRIARGKTRIYKFPATVTTSSRRLQQNGALRQGARDVWYIVQYLRGVPPEELAAKYDGWHRYPQISLIVFARLPLPGKVKTRLARDVGDEPAAEFYKICAEHVFRESDKVSGRVERYLFYSDPEDSREMQQWGGPRFNYVAQVGSDLGRRLEHAFSTVLEHGAQKAIVLATDVPDISADIIDEAFRGLDSSDAVLGPCPDGGYYLLGMRRLYKELFTNMPWSTNQVLDKTSDVMRKLGLTVRWLPALADIDTGEDLRRWHEEVSTPAHHPIHDLVRSLDLSRGSSR
jgi:rSAM/selenodomain-associated transferase 2/rSAM/selenodomain-associated transferase 1